MRGAAEAPGFAQLRQKEAKGCLAAASSSSQVAEGSAYSPQHALTWRRRRRRRGGQAARRTAERRRDTAGARARPTGGTGSALRRKARTASDGRPAPRVALPPPFPAPPGPDARGRAPSPRRSNKPTDAAILRSRRGATQKTSAGRCACRAPAESRCAHLGAAAQLLDVYISCSVPKYVRSLLDYNCYF